MDVCIADDAGNRFWKAHFLGKEKVGWSEFVAAFAKSLGAFCVLLVPVSVAISIVC